MKFFVPRSSFTIHIPETGPHGHLFVILTNTCKDGDNLIVPVCSIRAGRAYDPTCSLGVGDHDFLRHPSYVAYNFLKRENAANLVKKVADGVVAYKGIMADPVFARICAGVELSDDASPVHQRYFKAQIAVMRQDL